MSSAMLLGAAGLATMGAFTDMRTEKIPNWLTGSGAAAGLFLQFELRGYEGLRSGLEGALIAGAPFFLMFLLRVMGAGDVKLLAGVGVWVGGALSLSLVLMTAIAGGILAAGYTLVRKQTRATLTNLTELIGYHLVSGLRPHPELSLQAPSCNRLPYGLAIAAGTFCILIQHVGG